MEPDHPLLFSRLYAQVIAPESACSGCGACVLVCPRGRLVWRDGRPQQVSGDSAVCPEDKDGRCGLCARVCPRLEPAEQAPPAAGEPEVVAARTTDPHLAAVSQDGGLVSSIARWGLESKRWSSFLGTARDETWQPRPLVVTAGGEVSRISGSKYTYTSIDGGLAELHRLGRAAEPFATVGLPCHIAALRRLQNMRSKFVRGMELCIGLFCSKAFSYEGLIREKLANRMGIDLREVRRMDIRKGAFTVAMRSGAVHSLPVKDLAGYAHRGCASCDDFPAPLADLSVGGLGTDGWTIALIRTDRGREVVRGVEAAGLIETSSAEPFAKALALLEKLTLLKRQQAVRAHA